VNGNEFVTISGKAPLYSELLAQLAFEASKDLSIRSEASTAVRANSVGMDAQGNYWWRLSSEAAMENVLHVLGYLADSEFFRPTKVFPRGKTPDDE
jgi:hypothetical protein